MSKVKTTKLIHVTTVPSSCTFFRGQIEFMKSAGLDVSIVSSPGPDLEYFGRAWQVRAFSVPMSRKITPVADLFALCRLWLLLRRVKPDVVDGHTPKAGFLSMLAALLAGVRVRVFHIHGLPMTAATGWRFHLHRLVTRLTCGWASRVIAVGESMKSVVLAERLCPEGKLTVLGNGSSNGVDTSRFDAARFVREEERARIGVPSDALVIGFVGRLVGDKGLIELVAAWQTIRERFPNARMVMAGVFEPHRPLPAATADVLRVDPRIHLNGFAREPERLYATFDVLALPTYREGFPNAPLEAAAMGVPVVATRVPGCTDAVLDGVTGTLVRPGDVDGLRSAVAAYLENADMRLRHGRAGRDWVSTAFRPEPLWQALLGEYRALTRSERPRLEPNSTADLQVIGR